MPAVRRDPYGAMERLGRDEARRLLTTVPVGRVAISTDGAPIVLPVNFVVRGDDILLRTGPGEILAAALNRRMVSFEADGWDAVARTGWSVLVSGVAEELTRPSDLAEAERLRLEPWAPGLKGHVVRIRADAMTGRRIPQLSAEDVELPDIVLTGPDTPIGALALRRPAEVDARATIAEAIATLHEADTPVGQLAGPELGPGGSELVTLAGLVRLLGRGTSADEPAHLAAGQHVVVLTPQLAVIDAVQAMVERNIGCAVVRPTRGSRPGVLTLVDVMPALLWFFDPAVAALLPRG